jgi:hypothetical protein
MVDSVYSLDMKQTPNTKETTMNEYTVRDQHDDIVAAFDTEKEAIEYGSHLANANPDECYSVVAVIGLPDQRRDRVR